MAPTIYGGARDTGIPLRTRWGQGSIGDISALTIHHSAGPRATSKARAIELNGRYDAQHAAEGWGGIGYHFLMDDQGRLYRARPVSERGAHTAHHNTGNVGICVHGNYETDRLTRAQRATIKWLCQGGFYILTGSLERHSRLRGHKEWPDQATACPGKHLARHLKWRRMVSWP